MIGSGGKFVVETTRAARRLADGRKVTITVADPSGGSTSATDTARHARAAGASREAVEWPVDNAVGWNHRLQKA